MIDTNIGNYTIQRLIGEGGMASVYEAEHKMLGSKAAVKVLNPILSANHQIRERFKNEAKLMASLNHPNITRVIDFDEQPHHLSIIMEYLEGEDLNQKIKREGALTDIEITRIFNQILSAFQYAHEKGIVHRDIKPSNIFLLTNGQVKILDFGIAKLFGQGNEATQTGLQMGTPSYMSPEQVRSDKSIDYRSDIYSLGVTLFFAINGKSPYNSDTESQFDIFNKIVYEPLPDLSVNSIYTELIARACNKDREKRYQNCEEWITELNKINSLPKEDKGEIKGKNEINEEIKEQKSQISPQEKVETNEDLAEVNKEKIIYQEFNEQPKKSNRVAIYSVASIILIAVGVFFGINLFKNENTDLTNNTINDSLSSSLNDANKISPSEKNNDQANDIQANETDEGAPIDQKNVSPKSKTSINSIDKNNEILPKDQKTDIVKETPVKDVPPKVEEPKEEDYNKIFNKPEKEAEYPGGNGSWTKYITREIERKIDEIQDDGKSGTAVAIFIVDKDGTVSDVRILGCNEANVANCIGPGSVLANVILSAIKKGPKWIPASQNGRTVKAYRRQAVTFRIQE